jgi:hypothetical protein
VTSPDVLIVATDATTVDWVAAIGQVAGAMFTALAVAVALGIAIHDSRRQRREAETRALAQARHVLVGGTGERHEDEYHQLYIYFTNHSSNPIFEVYAEAWLDDMPVTEPPAAVMTEIVQPGGPEGGLFMLNIGREFKVRAWRVRWTDADGRQWCTDKPRPAPPVRYVGQSPE